LSTKLSTRDLKFVYGDVRSRRSGPSAAFKVLCIGWDCWCRLQCIEGIFCDYAAVIDWVVHPTNILPWFLFSCSCKVSVCKTSVVRWVLPYLDCLEGANSRPTEDCVFTRYSFCVCQLRCMFTVPIYKYIYILNSDLYGYITDDGTYVLISYQSVWQEKIVH